MVGNFKIIECPECKTRNRVEINEANKAIKNGKSFFCSICQTKLPSEMCQQDTKNNDKKVKKIAVLTLIIITLLFGYFAFQHGKSQALKRIPEDGKITLAIDCSEIMSYNNSVGNEWLTVAFVNGNRLNTNSTFVLNANIDDNIQLIVGAEEMDKIPDVGVKRSFVSIKNLNLEAENQFNLDVLVRENRGRYAGNTAKWVFTFTIKRQVNTLDIISNIFSRSVPVNSDKLLNKPGDLQQNNSNQTPQVATDRIYSANSISSTANVSPSPPVKEPLSDSSKIDGTKQLIANRKGYFSLLSTKDEVKKVMGTPTGVIGGEYISTWQYGLSSISFKDNQVTGWSTIDKPLKVWLGDKDANSPAISLYSTQTDVIKAMGTPTSVLGGEYINTWQYGLSSISFEGTRVVGWSTIDKPLKVWLGDRDTNAPPITIGSTKTDVIKAMGTPTGIIGGTYTSQWQYGLSSINLKDGKVSGWNIIDRPLKVK